MASCTATGHRREDQQSAVVDQAVDPHGPVHRTARNAAGIKYVSNARFITVRSPATRSRLIAKAEQVATTSVRTPVATAIRTRCRRAPLRAILAAAVQPLTHEEVTSPVHLWHCAYHWHVILAAQRGAADAEPEPIESTYGHRAATKLTFLR